MTHSVIDDAPYSGFHRKLTVVSAGGPFMDGFILTNVGIVSVGINQALDLNAMQFGLVGAAALLGMFFSAGAVGRLSDLIGRKQFYVVDMAIMIVASIMCFFVQDAWMLIALRFILGLAIGADFPIATSMLTEWLPKLNRGKAIGMLMLAWFLGANAAYIIGYVAVEFLPTDLAWRVVLASAGIIGIPLLIARLSSPESPRFLLSQGQRDKAQDNIRKSLGIDVTDAELDELSREEQVQTNEERAKPAKITDILRPPFGKRLLFCILFYTCQIVPLYAIYIYGPTILKSFNLDSESALGSLFISIIFTLGVLIAIGLVDRLGRRRLIVGCFAVMTFALFVLGILPTASVIVIISAFCLYALFSGGPSILEWIYPSELFPTRLRGMGVGIVTSASRIGAAVGIYLVPIALEQMGMGPVMIVGAIVTLVGFLASVAWAPETKGQTLAETTTSIPLVEKEAQLAKK